MKKVLKFVSLALCIAMFCGIFAACGQTEEPSQTAAGGEEVPMRRMTAAATSLRLLHAPRRETSCLLR